VPHHTLYWRSRRNSPPDVHCGGLAEAQLRSRRSQRWVSRALSGKSPCSDRQHRTGSLRPLPRVPVGPALGCWRVL